MIYTPSPPKLQNSSVPIFHFFHEEAEKHHISQFTLIFYEHLDFFSARVYINKQGNTHALWATFIQFPVSF